jgi:hypothetical protein
MSAPFDSANAPLGGLGGGAGLGASSDDFDMQAAWLRRAEADKEGFLSRFALLLEQALPGRAVVERKTRGIIRRESRVVGVRVQMEAQTFLMGLGDGPGIATSIEKVVRGVKISSRAVRADEWMKSLMEAIREQTSDAQAVSELLRGI